MAIVGIVGICVAIKSLKAIQRQALIMIQQSRILARQAKASEDAIIEARTSSQTLANIERAWVDVRLVRQGVNYLYTIEITNHGRTVAHINRIVTEVTVTPEGDAPTPPITTTYRKNKLLVPNQPWPPLHINLDVDLGTDTFRRIMKGEVRMDCRVTVHYAGIRPDCRSECLYYWDKSSSYSCLRPVEAPEYNQHT